MARAGEHRERFLKQFLKAELMVVRPGVIGINGEIQLPLALQPFILRRPQLLKDQARMWIKPFAIVG